MSKKIWIKEIKPIDIEGGYLIDGFPSIGFTSAIASESMISNSQFEHVGVIDSDDFFPMSIIKNGKPTFPTQIFVNKELKVAIFLSYYRIDEHLHRTVAKSMLQWANQHKCSLIVSSIAVGSSGINPPVSGIANTESAKNKLTNSGIPILNQGTIPGIPGILLNEGMLNSQDVVVLIINSVNGNPDFKAGAQLCLAMSQLIPGTACDLRSLEEEAENAEKRIIRTEKETNALKDAMYG